MYSEILKRRSPFIWLARINYRGQGHKLTCTGHSDVDGLGEAEVRFGAHAGRGARQSSDHEVHGDHQRHYDAVVVHGMSPPR